MKLEQVCGCVCDWCPLSYCTEEQCGVYAVKDFFSDRLDETVAFNEI